METAYFYVHKTARQGMKSERFLDLVALEEHEAANVARLEAAIRTGSGNVKKLRAEKAALIAAAIKRGIHQIEHPNALDVGTLLRREPNGHVQLSLEEVKELMKKARA